MRSETRIKAPAMMNRDAVVTAGSGNVFADLRLPNPELSTAKAQLVQRIRMLIAQRKLTEAAAARLLKIDRTKIPALIRGRVENYSIDRLFRFLHALGQEVEITIRPAESESRLQERPGIVVRH